MSPVPTNPAQESSLLGFCGRCRSRGSSVPSTSATVWSRVWRSTVGREPEPCLWDDARPAGLWRRHAPAGSAVGRRWSSIRPATANGRSWNVGVRLSPRKRGRAPTTTLCYDWSAAANGVTDAATASSSGIDAAFSSQSAAFSNESACSAVSSPAYPAATAAATFSAADAGWNGSQPSAGAGPSAVSALRCSTG